MIDEASHEVADDLTDEERAALAEDTPEGAPEAASDGPSESVTESRRDPDPILRVQAPADIEGRIAEVDRFEENVEAAFDEGEITAAEYRRHLRTANDARARAQWEGQKANLAAEMEETARDQRWNREVRSFMGTTGAPIAKSRAAMLAFDEFVKEVTADPAAQHLSDRQQLDKAHKLYLSEMEGVGFGIATVNEDSQNSRHAFAALDRLAEEDPEAYEARIAGMSEADRDAYARFL